MSIVKKIGVAALAGMGLLAAGSASAAVITQTHTIPTASTNWNIASAFNKFNTDLGPLQSIIISIAGTVSGNIKLESRDGAPTTISGTLQANQTVFLGAFTMVTNFPSITQSFGATAFDGTVDFGGTSGVTFSSLSSSSSNSATLLPTNLVDSLLYIPQFTCSALAATCGPQVSLSTQAVGTSSGQGAGNLTTEFNTSSGATLTLTYNYGVATPEPASMAVLGIGLVALGAYRRKRRH